MTLAHNGASFLDELRQNKAKATAEEFAVAFLRVSVYTMYILLKEAYT